MKWTKKTSAVKHRSFTRCTLPSKRSRSSGREIVAAAPPYQDQSTLLAAATAAVAETQVRDNNRGRAIRMCVSAHV